MKKLLLFCFVALLAVPSLGRSDGNLHETPLVRIALNYYSFNTPLRDGSENIESVIDYAAGVGFDAVDATGYYFPGYPAVPSDEYILKVKYHAFHQGMTICGTGIKNDFAVADPVAREKEKRFVKDWIVVASKLGASTLRIFTGAKIPEGYTWEQAAKWIAEDIDECALFAERYGIMLAVQNHNDFLKTADQVESFLALVKSDNVGLMLDIGCYRSGDPYSQIEQTVKYAVTWQIKENVYIDGVATKTDIGRVMDIVKRNGFRGFVPIEILNPGTERERAKVMFEKVRAARDGK